MMFLCRTVCKFPFFCLYEELRHQVNPGGGGIPYKSEADALRLALGCKLQVFVSLRVFGMESYYICPFRYHLVLCIQKCTKNVPTLTTQTSPLGVSLSLNHQHCSTWEVNLNFPTLEHPRHSYTGAPPEVSTRWDAFLLTDKTYSLGAIIGDDMR